MAHPSDELYGPIVRMGHKGGPITPLSAALLERRFTASRSGRNVVLGGRLADVLMPHDVCLLTSADRSVPSNSSTRVNEIVCYNLTEQSEKVSYDRFT